MKLFSSHFLSHFSRFFSTLYIRFFSSHHSNIFLKSFSKPFLKLLLTFCLSLSFYASNTFANNTIEYVPFFSEAQEEFLAKNSSVYAYFSQLYVAKLTPEQIAKKYQLSNETTQKYLKSLAEHHIIETKTDKNGNLTPPIKFLVSGVSTFSPKGALAQRFTAEMFSQYYNKVVTDFKNENKETYSAMPGFYLTTNEYEQFKQEIQTLEQKYIEISVKNRKSKVEAANRVSSLFALVHNWEPSVFNDIRKDF